MKNDKAYYILGGTLCLLAAGFIAVALMHPELSFPWANWVSYTIYALYGIYTVLVFLMPRFKGASIAACGIVALQFVALSLIAIYIGVCGTVYESSLYLIIGLDLTCAANFTLFAMRKKGK